MVKLTKAWQFAPSKTPVSALLAVDRRLWVGDGALYAGTSKGIVLCWRVRAG